MAKALTELYLARHGETAWSVSGQHTGRTDITLTERGERRAPALGERNSDQYEGRRTADILRAWQLFREGCPGRNRRRRPACAPGHPTRMHD